MPMTTNADVVTRGSSFYSGAFYEPKPVISIHDIQYIHLFSRRCLGVRLCL